MKILITGALGNLGLTCIEQALSAGHKVRCFDLDTPQNRLLAANLASKAGHTIEFVWGDLLNLKSFPDLTKGIDAIFHNASVLPPLTEKKPSLAYQINVVATQELLHLAEKQSRDIIFIYPSSVTVFGLPTDIPSIKTAAEPVHATDHYTQYKITCEDLVKNSPLPWCILRVGVSVDSRTTKTDFTTLKTLLQVNPQNTLEYVHPKDVASAMCNAIEQPRAFGKVLLIGGGIQCQVTQSQFLNAAFNGCGLTLKTSSFGYQKYYTHWMDTKESQQLLNYQTHTFNDYKKEMAQAFRKIRYSIAPLKPAVNWALNLIATQISKA